MIRLQSLFALMLMWHGVCSVGVARAPKIYNALITSDENLSPSQAFPIIEPVLRTTPLFHPLVIHQQQQPQPQKQTNDKLQYQDSYPLYPLAYDPYLQYGYHQNFVYSPPLPYYQQPVYIDYAHAHYQQSYNNQPEKVEQSQENPKPVVPVLPPTAPSVAAPPHVNFKKNPDIPDVIPPLPFTLRKESKQKRHFFTK